MVTRSQQKAQENAESACQRREKESGVCPHSDLGEEGYTELQSSLPDFDDSLFTGGRDRIRLSRSEKRQMKHEFRSSELGREKHPLDLSSEEMKKLQWEDPTLKEICKAVRQHPSTAGVGFYEENGVLYRRWIPPGRDTEEMAIEQLVLPVQCRAAVLKLAHGVPFAGHLGRDKTAHRILHRFYWPTVYKDVADFVKTCAECQKTAPRCCNKAPLIPLPIMEEPYKRIAMDIIGPLPRSRTGKKYVLVVCDYATRFPEAIPMKSVDAEHVAEELLTLFSRVGVPEEILTDQGSNFTSQLLTELYRMLHVHAIRTTPYHPQTDGLVERFNKTLKSMLRRAACTEGKDWDKLIPYLLFAYREVTQASTGFSPFELLYGRQVRGPLDVLRETWEASSRSSDSVVSYVLSVQEKLEKMRFLVRENLLKAQKKQKKWYDSKARLQEFKQGDQVLVMLPTSGNKLFAQWQGPYKVEKKVGKVNYQVNMSDRRKKLRIFHVNMLRKFFTSEFVGYLQEEGDLEEDDSDWDPKSGCDDKPKLGEQLSGEQREQLQQLITEFPGVWSGIPGRTDQTEHRVETGNASPVRLPPYRLPHAFRVEVQKEVDEMLKSGVIEPSTSEWSAPIVPVRKKDGSLRLCIDYRRLNSISKADAYPMPRVDDLIDRLGKAKYISTLDLAKGYWQVPVAKESRPKTAFSTPFGLFQFNVMPFGLRGAPATFQRLMDQVVAGLDATSSYIDDLVIYSDSWEEHVEHLRQVFKRLQESNLTVKAKKCQLGMCECTYLGHVVGGGVVRPEASKIGAVTSFPRPQTKKQVREFLGLTGYYRRFIPGYASISAPLSDLTKKALPNQVKWSEACERAFLHLQNCLCKSPILHNPDFERPFILQTDASDRGVGAVLSQRDDNGADHPIAYFSRKLLPREERYSTVEKECLAIKLGVHAFRVYLIGRHFTVQTDHHALTWLDRLKENNPRLTRWSLSLQPYDFEVTYRPGKANGNADALSRAVVN